MEYILNSPPNKDNINPKTQSLRKQEEFREVIGVPNNLKTFKQPTLKVGYGEYAPTVESRHKRFRHYLDNNYFANPDEKEHLEKIYRIREEYQYYGLKLGLFFGAVAYLFPGIRRLAFYKRIPIAGFVYYGVCRAFINYGDDVFEQRSIIVFENIEKDNRIRNYVLAL